MLIALLWDRHFIVASFFWTKIITLKWEKNHFSFRCIFSYYYFLSWKSYSAVYLRKLWYFHIFTSCLYFMNLFSNYFTSYKIAKNLQTSLHISLTTISIETPIVHCLHSLLITLTVKIQLSSWELLSREVFLRGTSWQYLPDVMKLFLKRTLVFPINYVLIFFQPSLSSIKFTRDQ